MSCDNARRILINGILLFFRVPMDKNLSYWSSQYFFLAPLRWCFTCQQTILSHELNSAGQCRICNHKPYELKNNKKKFISFPNIKKYPHLNYLPVCYKTKRRKRNNFV